MKRASLVVGLILALTGALAPNALGHGRHFPFNPNDPLVQLVPDQPPPGTLAPTVPARYRVNNVGWVRVRNQPWDYVIGNAGNGWALDAVRYNSDGTWLFGYLYSGFSGCGYVRIGSDLYKTNEGYNLYCQGVPSMSGVSEFAIAYNGCSGSNCDGYSTTLKASCTGVNEYANVRPWAVPSSAGELVRGPFPGSGYQVYWRYISNDNNWAMVRDPHYGDQSGNWVFVWKDCLSSFPGYTYVG